MTFFAVTFFWSSADFITCINQKALFSWDSHDAVIGIYTYDVVELCINQIHLYTALGLFLPVLFFLSENLKRKLPKQFNYRIIFLNNNKSLKPFQNYLCKSRECVDYKNAYAATTKYFVT